MSAVILFDEPGAYGLLALIKQRVVGVAVRRLALGICWYTMDSRDERIGEGGLLRLGWRDAPMLSCRSTLSTRNPITYELQVRINVSVLKRLF